MNSLVSPLYNTCGGPRWHGMDAEALLPDDGAYLPPTGFGARESSGALAGVRASSSPRPRATQSDAPASHAPGQIRAPLRLSLIENVPSERSVAIPLLPRCD